MTLKSRTIYREKTFLIPSSEQVEVFPIRHVYIQGGW